MSEQQKIAILDLLDAGCDRLTIAARVGVSPAQVSAIAAHVTMGTYVRDRIQGRKFSKKPASQPCDERAREPAAPTDGVADAATLLVGRDAETGESVAWDPFPQTGSANPHVLVLGESGFGKTYVVQCLLGEIASAGIPSIIFDYAQGFSLKTLPREFVEATNPVEIKASEDGVAINPLEIFPTDVHGPVSVAQRVADTFTRVYPKIGIQQHAALRQAVLDVFEDHGFSADGTQMRGRPLPLFTDLQQALTVIAADIGNPYARFAGSVSAHISTMFIFNTFRASGRKLNWSNVLTADGKAFIIQLKALELSLERAVTEFLLWNLIGWIESAGPSALRVFVVLDEAHKLSFEAGSPTERLLREGRKFGVGLILASQQPADFSSVAFNNTSTKVIFQTADERGSISRLLFHKTRNVGSAAELHRTITQLPPRTAYVVSQNAGRTVKITSMEERIDRWREPRLPRIR